MLFLSKLSVFVLVFTFLAALSQIAATQSIYNHENHIHSASNYTYLVTGGYRPPRQALTKYLVSIGLVGYTLFFGDNHFCGGAVIAPDLVLTAAHCLVDYGGFIKHQSSNLQVTAGSPNRFEKTSMTQIRGVKEQNPHPRFDLHTNRNDIAVLVLDAPLELNSYVQAIPLPKEPAARGTSCTVIGWGKIFDRGPLTAEVLYADVKIWETTMCKEIDQYVDGILCANDLTNSEVDACVGDSGGPLICYEILTGIVSFGIGCGTPGYPGFYTDVYRFMKFVVYNDISDAASVITFHVLLLYVAVTLAVWS